MKCWKTCVEERVCERHSLGFQCKKLCLSHLSLQCSLCFCEPLGGLVCKMYSGARAVQYLICAQNMYLTEPSLAPRVLKQATSSDSEKIELYISIQNSATNYQTKWFRAADCIVIMIRKHINHKLWLCKEYSLNILP